MNYNPYSRYNINNGPSSFPNFNNRFRGNPNGSNNNTAYRFTTPRNQTVVDILSTSKFDKMTQTLSIIQKSLSDLTNQVHSLSSRITTIEFQLNAKPNSNSSGSPSSGNGNNKNNKGKNNVSPN